MGQIKATRKYENPITFPETHKLWMDCNHKPRIVGSDNAIWNRLHLIPYTVTIPTDEIDRDLPGKLIAEAEGILAWTVEGARRWYAEGLGRPQEVDEAVKGYRAEMDQIGRFIEERCIAGEFAQSKAGALYAAYKQWAELGVEHALAQRDFGPEIVDRGFIKKHTETGAVYLGIGLRADG
jgi:putative DNA primase/helicase